MTSFDIPSLILDPQNEEEVIQSAYDRIRSSSNGTINDFSPSSPIAALVEGQAFVYMELLWYLNQLPTALALEVFRLLGIQRSPGATAKGYITFVLSASLATDFIVSAGYFIPHKDAGFVTKNTLVIPAGSIEAKVLVEATREGSDLNVPPFGISSSGVSLTYLQSIYNDEYISGGADIEPLTDTVNRASTAVRTRGTLISQEDYEQVSAFLLGSGSYSTAFPLLTSDKETKTLGHVHVFLLDQKVQQPSVATCQAIQQELRDRSFTGAAIWVSPADIAYYDMEVVLKVQTIDEALAERLEDALAEYLRPDNFGLGNTLKIKELEYVVRNQEGVQEVITLTVNNEAVNVPMDNAYTQPKLGTLTVVLMDAIGTTSTIYRVANIDPGQPLG